MKSLVFWYSGCLSHSLALFVTRSCIGIDWFTVGIRIIGMSDIQMAKHSSSLVHISLSHASVVASDLLEVWRASRAVHVTLHGNVGVFSLCCLVFVVMHLNNHNKQQNKPDDMHHKATLEHRQNQRRPFYRAASYARPDLPITPWPNLTLPQMHGTRKEVSCSPIIECCIIWMASEYQTKNRTVNVKIFVWYSDVLDFWEYWTCKSGI